MDDEKKLQFCLKEIEVIQATIARFDNNGSTIKSWCITTWSAISAYAITERQAAVAVVSLAVILGFALLEFTYRRFQKRFIDRARDIENILATGELSSYSYLVDKAASTKGSGEILHVLRLPHFIVFYIMLAIFSIVVTVYCVKYPLHEYSLYLRLST